MIDYERWWDSYSRHILIKYFNQNHTINDSYRRGHIWCCIYESDIRISLTAQCVRSQIEIVFFWPAMFENRGGTEQHKKARIYTTHTHWRKHIRYTHHYTCRDTHLETQGHGGQGLARERRCVEDEGDWTGTDCLNTDHLPLMTNLSVRINRFPLKSDLIH